MMAKKDIPENKVIPDSEKAGVYIARVVTGKGTKEVHRSRRLARKQGNNATPSIGSTAEAHAVFGIKPEPSEAQTLENEPALMSSTTSLLPPSLSLPLDDSLPSTESVHSSPEILDTEEEVSKQSEELCTSNDASPRETLPVKRKLEFPNDNPASPSPATFPQPQRLPQPPTLLQNAMGLLKRPSLTFGLTLGTGLFLTGFGLPVAALAFAGSLGGIEIIRKIRETQAKSAITKTETEASTRSISTNDAEPNVTLLPEYGLELGSTLLQFRESPSRTSSSSLSCSSSSSTFTSKGRCSTP
jgi:hypothetical protein